MTNKIKKLSLVIIALFIFSFPISAVMAEASSSVTTGSKTLLKTLGDTAGYVTADNEKALPTYIGTIVSVALGLLGIIFVILMIYAGYSWLTAAGDQAKVDKAKDTIWRAVIGLLIVVGAYAIWGVVQKILF